MRDHGKYESPLGGVILSRDACSFFLDHRWPDRHGPAHSMGPRYSRGLNYAGGGVWVDGKTGLLKEQKYLIVFFYNRSIMEEL